MPAGAGHSPPYAISNDNTVTALLWLLWWRWLAFSVSTQFHHEKQILGLLPNKPAARSWSQPRPTMRYGSFLIAEPLNAVNIAVLFLHARRKRKAGRSVPARNDRMFSRYLHGLFPAQALNLDSSTGCSSTRKKTDNGTTWLFLSPLEGGSAAVDSPAARCISSVGHAAFWSIR